MPPRWLPAHWTRSWTDDARNPAAPPLVVVVLLVLGSGWIAWAGVGCGIVLALTYWAAYFDPSVEHRLAKPDRMRPHMQTYRDNADCR